MKARAFFIGLTILAISASADWPISPQPGNELPAPSFNVADASLEDLFFKAQVYATTPQKRADKHAAREAFFEQGPDALTWLMNHIHIENLWIRIMAFELVRQLPAEDAFPVLTKALESDEETHKKYALFFLGFYDRPETPPDLTVYLEEDKLQGGAIRTLGKWQTTNAVPQLLPFLHHEKERICIMTANALRDIADPSATNALTQALNDEFFTVRKTAERAIKALKTGADQTL